MLKKYSTGQGGNMIYIDFQGGSHGNYLEFVCNKFLGDVSSESDVPFNDLGASHDKKYTDQKVFNAWHYFNDSYGKRTTPESGKIISIKISEDDVLPLSAVSLLRAGNYGNDNDQLEKDTYNKLNNVDCRSTLDNLLSSFFKKQIETSYNAVKDSSWPEVKSLSDFENLPTHIKDECINVHNLTLLKLDENYPDCPRHILREFFSIGFKNPESQGFLATQKEKMWYYSTNDVYYFPFNAFYSLEKFVDEIYKIATWSGYELNDESSLVELHNQFLERQIYKDSKQTCDEIIEKCMLKDFFKFPKLNMLEEAYILAKIELITKKNLSVKQWFRDNLQLKKAIYEQ